MAVAALTISAEREAVVDFAYQIYENNYAMAVLKPKPGGSSYFRVFRPFTPLVWTLVVSLILVCALLFLGTVIPRKRMRQVDEECAAEDEDLKDSSFSHTLLGIYSQFVSQNMTMNIPSISSRCILAFWMLFCILITTSYTSELIGYLTVSDTKPSVNTLKDLANSQHVVPLSFPGSSAIPFFQVQFKCFMYGKTYVKSRMLYSCV